MGWMLVMLVLWDNQSFTVQVSMESEELCEAAITKAGADLIIDPTQMITAAGSAEDIRSAPRSIQTCIRVAREVK